VSAQLSAQELAAALVKQAIAETKKLHGQDVYPVVTGWMVKVGQRKYYVSLSERS
jgi:hypothetical protein